MCNAEEKCLVQYEYRSCALWIRMGFIEYGFWNVLICFLFLYFSFLLHFVDETQKLISRTGSLRPTSGPTLSKRSRNNTNNGVERHKSKLPRGMYINHDDIVKLASQDNNRGDDLLTNMDREISTLLSQVRDLSFLSFEIKRK